MEANMRTSVRSLTAAQATHALGDGSFHVTSALFLTQVVGLTVAQTGLWLSVAWAVGFALSTPIGHAADLWGLRRWAVTLSVLVAVSLVLATQIHHPLGFLAVITAYAVAQSGLAAVRQAMVGTVVPPEDRVAVRARIHVAVNTGLGLGAVLGALVLASGADWAYAAVFWFDAGCFLVGALLLRSMPATPGRRTGVPGPLIPFRGGVLRDAPYVMAAALCAVLYLYMPTLTVVLPLFIVRETAAPDWAAAALFVINTVGVIALQMRAARTVQDMATATTGLRRGGLALGAACLVFAAVALPTSPEVALLIVCAGAAVQVLGEVLLAAGSWHIGFTLADPDRPGQWQGLFASGLPLARSIGPVLLTGLILTWSGPGWWVLAALFAVAGLAIAPVAAWGERRLALRSPNPTTDLMRTPSAVAATAD
jgi:MFS family permease